MFGIGLAELLILLIAGIVLQYALVRAVTRDRMPTTVTSEGRDAGQRTAARSATDVGGASLGLFVLIGVVVSGGPLLGSQPETGGGPYDQFVMADAIVVGLGTFLTATVLAPALAVFRGGIMEGMSASATTLRAGVAAMVATATWFAVGQSLAFSSGDEAQPLLGGLDDMFWARSFSPDLFGTITSLGFASFILATAVAAAAAVHPTRAGSSAYAFTAVWLAAVLAPSMFWIWGGGWLFEAGAMDFAGGFIFVAVGVTIMTVDATVGQAAAPRPALPDRGLDLWVAVGLTIGAAGLNLGSALEAGEYAQRAAVGTLVSAAAGWLGWTLLTRLRGLDFNTALQSPGIVAGAIAALPAVASTEPPDWIVIGGLAGALCGFVIGPLDQATPIRSGGIFAIAGSVGLVAIPILAEEPYVGVSTQAIVIVSVAGLSMAVSWMAGKMLLRGEYGRVDDRGVVG